MTQPGQSNQGSWGGGSPKGDAAGLVNPGGAPFIQGQAWSTRMLGTVPLVSAGGIFFQAYVPNDGVPHIGVASVAMNVTSALTGGAINLSTIIGGTPVTLTMISANSGQANGITGPPIVFIADPGSIVQFQQASISGGAGVILGAGVLLG